MVPRTFSLLRIHWKMSKVTFFNPDRGITPSSGSGSLIFFVRQSPLKTAFCSASLSSFTHFQWNRGKSKLSRYPNRKNPCHRRAFHPKIQTITRDKTKMEVDFADRQQSSLLLVLNHCFIGYLQGFYLLLDLFIVK